MTRILTVIGVHGFLADNNSANCMAAHSLEYAELTGFDVKVYAPDLPGHGSEPLNGMTTLDEFAIYLRQKIEENVKGPYIVIGFSMGGMITLKYSELFHFDKNMLGIGIWASPLRPFKESLTPFLKDYMGSYVLNFFPNTVFTKLTRNKYLIDFMKKIDTNIAPLERDNLKKIIDILSNQNFNLDIPVSKCFVYGTFDPLITKDNYKYLCSIKPDLAEYHLVSKAGHFATKTAARKVYKIFGNYIKKLVADSAVFAADVLSE